MKTTPLPPVWKVDLKCTWTNESDARERLGGLLCEMASGGLTPCWAVLYASRREATLLIPVLTAAGAWSHWPLMILIVPGESAPGGFQVLGTRAPAHALRDRGRVVGLAWVDECGRARASLCGLTPRASHTPSLATADLLERATGLLEQAGLAWPDVYRTWYYNDDILSWYGDFNRVRTACYREAGIDFRRSPASTGIGLANADGSPLTLALLAASPGVTPGPVPSPLQNAAMNYGSLFSRACEETYDRGRCLWISGTAAIDAEGRTEHLGDFDAQVRRTYDVVGAILESRRMAWADVSRATAYIRNPGDLPRFRRLGAEGVIPELDAVVIPATVCRDDLLFEIELEAVR